MALELLAGPFTIHDFDDELIAAASSVTIAARAYDDAMCGIMWNDTEKTYLTAWDGLTAVVSDTDRVYYTIDLSDYPIITPRKYQVTNTASADSTHLYNKEAGVREGARLHDGSTNEALNLDVKLPDRYIGVIASQVYTKPLNLAGQSGYGAQECLLTKGPWSGSAAITDKATVSLARDREVIAAVFPDGTIIYYNHITKTQVQRWDFIGTNKGAWYSEYHDVWIRWGADNQIYIHASTAAPYALSNPAGDAPLKGKSTVYTVQLLGAHLEPIAGELIEWGLGEGDPGLLSSTQSATDDSGTASIRYYAPVNGSGDVTIHAGLRY